MGSGFSRKVCPRGGRHDFAATLVPVLTCHLIYQPEHLVAHLIHFALPLTVRRELDAQAFLTEGNKTEAASLIDQQARLAGQAQYSAVQRDWPSVAALIEQVAALEERLIAVCASW